LALGHHSLCASVRHAGKTLTQSARSPEHREHEGEKRATYPSAYGEFPEIQP
jgi:hypothetical protein